MTGNDHDNDNGQAVADHESPKTTELYGRTGDRTTLDMVEPIMA